VRRQPEIGALTLLIPALFCSGCVEETVLLGPNSQWPWVVFRLPLLETELFSPPIGVDHDPQDYEGVEQAICTNYYGERFPGCYDGHDGSDFLLAGDWAQMDAGSATIVAAADGLVVYTEDGHYDRCHGDFTSFDSSCDGHSGTANAVILEHQTPYGPVLTRYWHMKTDSVAVELGDEVACGDTLGRVGSSGNSSQPHLHFEVEFGGNYVDPYAGLYSQSESWWVEQGETWEIPGAVCQE
jgi:murein DD-endopeptidase MepM/ murein hydrolase activator NlpD